MRPMPLLAALLLGAIGNAPAAPASATDRTIIGQLVDAACYRLDKSNIGADHRMPQGEEKNCAVECVRTGLPAALLTPTGTVYIVTGALAANDNEDLVPHLSHRVALTGKVTEEGSTMTIAATDLRVLDN